jgi:hypothetical protein
MRIAARLRTSVFILDSPELVRGICAALDNKSRDNEKLVLRRDVGVAFRAEISIGTLLAVALA